MEAIAQQIADLIIKYLDDNLEEAERVELYEWVNQSEANRQQFEALTNRELLIQKLQQFEGYDRSRGWQKLAAACQLEEAPVIAMPAKRNAWKYIAAASVLLLLVAGYWFLQDKKMTGNGQQTEVAVKAGDIKAPDKSRATITLADGSVVYLDSVANGQVAVQDNVKLVKDSEGRVVYSQESGVGSQQLRYNTLTNPKGSKVIDMTLSDGSHVWLNAGSSVSYPVAFVGSERKVSITGEAYFEVAHNPSKPFYVTKGEMEVKVLGTHFNVNAYEDEEAIRVTLLEGSVEVKSQNSKVKSQKVRIQPGEQAVVTLSQGEGPKSNQSTPIQVQTADLQSVMAWKNGRFKFKDADIETVMKQIARWYDVDVAYKSKPGKLFRGSMPRTMTLEKVFHILEETGGVHFHIEGKKVIVVE